MKIAKLEVYRESLYAKVARLLHNYGVCGQTWIAELPSGYILIRSSTTGAITVEKNGRVYARYDEPIDGWLMVTTYNSGTPIIDATKYI
jgi:hypothetical protein